LPQPLLALRQGSQKALLRPVLLREPRLDSTDIGVESGNRRGRGLCECAAGTGRNDQQSAKNEKTSESDDLLCIMNSTLLRSCFQSNAGNLIS
jgi:hypothetical protein